MKKPWELDEPWFTLTGLIPAAVVLVVAVILACVL